MMRRLPRSVSSWSCIAEQGHGRRDRAGWESKLRSSPAAAEGTGDRGVRVKVIGPGMSIVYEQPIADLAAFIESRRSAGPDKSG
jgi:hypothetical protein